MRGETGKGISMLCLVLIGFEFSVNISNTRLLLVFFSFPSRKQPACANIPTDQHVPKQVIL